MGRPWKEQQNYYENELWQYLMFKIITLHPFVFFLFLFFTQILQHLLIMEIFFLFFFALHPNILNHSLSPKIWIRIVTSLSVINRQVLLSFPEEFIKNTKKITISLILLVILFLISNPILGNPQYQGNLFYTIRAMKKQSDSDFDVKCATVQFYRNSYNSQFDSWIGLKLYVESLDMSSYLGLKFQVNRSLERHCNIGQQSVYEFCYLLSFDLWTSYLARIFFLQGCDSWFWGFPSLAWIFNGQQHSFHVWYGLRINVESLWCMKTIILSLL
jgi:hypothetical protein